MDIYGPSLPVVWVYGLIFTQERRFFGIVYCLVRYWFNFVIVDCESRAYSVDCRYRDFQRSTSLLSVVGSSEGGSVRLFACGRVDTGPPVLIYDRNGGMRIDMPSNCGAATATATAVIMRNSTPSVPQIYQCRSFSYPNVLRAALAADEEGKRKFGQCGNISSHLMSLGR